jgi:carotenoid 1,2-hydratase
MQRAIFRPAGPLRPSLEHGAGRDRCDDAERLQQDVSRDGWRALRAGIARVGRLFHAADCEDAHPGPVSGGGRDASGTRTADGGVVGTSGCGRSAFQPRFDGTVPNGGYVWWYVDALSDDGEAALTIIAFVGSVFSPYYAATRQWGDGDPLQHCALNVALYGRRKRWAMTERTRADVERTASTFAIGPSAITWDGSALTIAINEVAFPLPSRIRGTVRVTPGTIGTEVIALDGDAKHFWQPIAPRGRIDVTLESPEQRWTGDSYLDCNFGCEPLEKTFKSWNWSRAHVPGGTDILYDLERRDGTTLSLARQFREDCKPSTVATAPVARLPFTKWRVQRDTRADAGAIPRVIKTLEDTPFYARSLIETTLDGSKITAMHESLSLDRLANPLVRLMLPFRMPRWAYRRLL